MSPLPPDLENKNASLVEKRNAIAKRLSEVEGKNEQKSKIDHWKDWDGPSGTSQEKKM